MASNDFYLKDTFVESPIFDNWFKKHYPQKSLLICSPYIKKDALNKVITLYKLNERDTNFDLKVLIRGNNNEFTYQKSSDVSAFDSLICLKGFDLSNIKRVTNLHMKAYLIDGRHLLITSGNLTNSGMFVVSGKENFEGSISTNDPGLICKFLQYFSRIWNQGDVLEDFYDNLMSAYTTYIEKEYTDKVILERISRRKYKFITKTNFDDIEQSVITRSEEEHKPIYPGVVDEPSIDVFFTQDNDTEDDLIQHFTLDDIPPVGNLTHIPAVLKYVSEKNNGITYLELGRRLRAIFSNSDSTEIVADRKFGEEKGKFAAFLNLVNIEDSKHGKIIKINNLGRTYMSLNDEDKNKLIKDIFFDKPIIVSIMRQSLETPDFDLFKFLQRNCDGATDSTLSRKVRPLKNLFAHISSICTEEELKNALTNM